ncbi:hypothetical protein CEE69_24175 [Rhodopirellula bahusiensis]|uniref:Uncharacterized protein n=1 Tax=Rhodopirellula bahusiensis TaxID=2014065 RepID=A0A2G1W163_9BACT|nr:hypothetical protein CEE69_24175 [Rhodopirellula bahusiensis]
MNFLLHACGVELDCDWDSNSPDCRFTQTADPNSAAESGTIAPFPVVRVSFGPHRTVVHRRAGSVRFSDLSFRVTIQRLRKRPATQPESK